ncbi:response regulator transcription factor [Candidatus Halocynthiibacter alkanivorans]|uniref:response regulator transcription factor n=1 Tax=Candidatus Halocynthiibacter alkanivorans TaxID=2267619 RepID=UPI000DF1CD51|nr:helix-turn-helix transcriptional regulator [Candidatus Halocynthiibacter alkanivorans]
MTTAPTAISNLLSASEFYAEIIDVIGTETFFPDIAKVVEQHLRFDGLFICIYSKDSAPMTLGCFKEALSFQTGIENYVKYSYVINPVYRAFQQGVSAGAYVMTDFLPQSAQNQIAKTDLHIWIDDEETIGYRTPGWPRNMIEVLGLIPLPGEKMVELCFMNALESNQTQSCYAGLQDIFPALSSALIKHVEFAAQDFESSDANPNMEFRILDFGKQVLTEREHSVVQLILKGHSSASIALNLEISLPTVKTHRRNIYSKLQISSQAELFSLFVQQMMEMGN